MGHAIETDWGAFRVEWSNRGLTRLDFPGEGRVPWNGDGGKRPAFVRRFAEALRRYIDGELVEFDVPVDLSRASEFARAVYEASRRVPYGRLSTYGAIARELGRPEAARAVGAALGQNPVGLVVPCHRIVGSSGELVGFSATEGVGLKRRLLELEGAFPAGGTPAARLALRVPADFHFEHTVTSHGWFDLAPFGYHRSLGSLHFAQELAQGRAASVRVRTAGRRLAVEVHSAGALSRADRRAVKKTASRVLGLDRELAPFHAELRRRGTRSWIPAGGFGRFLAAPTAWEDLAKTLLSTNASWSLLRSAVARLVKRLGTPAPGGLSAFPGPERIARMSERFLRSEFHVGYRAPYLHELARRASEGQIDWERWEDPATPAEEIRAEILGLPGFGEYAAANVLRILGRFDRLGLDSWLRGEYRRLFPRRDPSDAAIARAYEGFGEHRGLVLWLDLTRRWHPDAGDSAGARGERPPWEND
ncbi:MAG: methylated-DNA--[protein]-cysteine S-methyltransferase [Planctomycetes bacterium]|nr:methylated-DNA--[protein]-cysteine S-methyltransferase [Planctomycetota bacterium]